MTKLGAIGRRLLLRLPARMRPARLMRLLLSLWERLASLGGDHPLGLPPDGYGWPPPRLRLRVVGTVDLDWFVRSGEESMKMIERALRRADVAPATLESILDLGCGCGRVAHKWPSRTSASISGCDVDDELISWCRDQYPWLDVRRNDPLPPTTFASSSFDFVYALSVFTHLTEDTQRRWLDELHRILRPSGLLLITTHGQSHTSKLSRPDREAFGRGELVVELRELEGSNLCAAYHPREHVEQMLRAGFDLLSFEPTGGESSYAQDVILARRRP